MSEQRKNSRLSYIVFRIVRDSVKFFYPRITLEGTENINDEVTIIVGNHTQMNGPICAELYSPVESVTWCAYQMMYLKEVPSYAYKDFWSKKPKLSRPFYKLLSYIIAPLSVCVFNNAKTIPVYHDTRLLSTFKQTIGALQDGKSVVVFPECYDEHNHIVNKFQDRFIDVAKLYYNRTGKVLTFTPVYIVPDLKKMVFGPPVKFKPDEQIEQERTRICNYLMDTITHIAVSLPAHTVVPYENIPKKKYKKNIESETNNEKTGC